MFTDIIHRCRNKGGTDVTYCSPTKTFDTNVEVDLVCGNKKPLYRYCQLVALNDPSNGPHYTFTDYQWFTKPTANSVCEDLSGSLPRIVTQLDGVYLKKVIEYLSDFVNVETPFSLKWSSWPVSIFRALKYQIYSQLFNLAHLLRSLINIFFV